MLRSMYIAGTGMLVQRYRMDVITNNVANADTSGYKTDNLLSRSFSDMMLSRLNDPSVINRSTAVGPQNTGIHIDEVITNFTQGGLENTGRSLDLAIQGDGFFTVDTPAGARYTRAGSFTLNAQGYLTTAEGYYVLDINNQPIQIGTDDFGVDSSGNVSVNGNTIARIAVVEFQDTGALRKAGDNLYTVYGNANPYPAQNSSVMQGYLENSNLDIAKEMTNMITTERAYEASQRILRMIDDTLGKTVNEIARF